MSGMVGKSAVEASGTDAVLRLLDNRVRQTDELEGRLHRGKAIHLDSYAEAFDSRERRAVNL